MKIDLMILVAMVAISTRKQLMTLAPILAISIGIYGVKGGLFTLPHGGA